MKNKWQIPCLCLTLLYIGMIIISTVNSIHRFLSVYEGKVFGVAAFVICITFLYVLFKRNELNDEMRRDINAKFLETHRQKIKETYKTKKDD